MKTLQETGSKQSWTQEKETDKAKHVHVLGHQDMSRTPGHVQVGRWIN